MAFSRRLPKGFWVNLVLPYCSVGVLYLLLLGAVFIKPQAIYRDYSTYPHLDFRPPETPSFTETIVKKPKRPRVKKTKKVIRPVKKVAFASSEVTPVKKPVYEGDTILPKSQEFVLASFQNTSRSFNKIYTEKYDQRFNAFSVQGSLHTGDRGEISDLTLTFENSEGEYTNISNFIMRTQNKFEYDTYDLDGNSVVAFGMIFKAVTGNYILTFMNGPLEHSRITFRPADMAPQGESYQEYFPGEEQEYPLPGPQGGVPMEQDLDSEIMIDL